MSTPADKLKAIRRLKFPTTLQGIKQLLGFTESLQYNVPRYAMIINLLQQRKTNLQRAAKAIKDKREEKTGKKPGPQKSAYRHTANATLLLKPTTAELTAFNEIKTALT
ncbi:hypothetical protein BFJ72_g12496 [Fusarium proliferatum]|uniref:Uncharacterized protein n=1 Tax=Gibberella intermedia TaxID=948311 RepID=A0A420SGM4_GIBIN|nr:hypothetical protein BFJ72_g12496 [Fusarium proliferatum]